VNGRGPTDESNPDDGGPDAPDGPTSRSSGSDSADEGPLHLLSVWNPSYADDAMDRHLEVLLEWARRRDEGEAQEEDVYVWWGKLRSPRREEPLPHRDEVLSLSEQIAAGIDTHLYLTDHRSLYVARLVEVTDDPVLEETPGELDHMPGYYQDHEVDFWFRIWDLRRLVQNDTPAVIEELKRLRNVRYHDRPVSLYGGLVDLPLLVRREEPAGWFDDLELLTGGRRWAERDATLRGETERISRELRHNLLGERVWAALEPATRTFLASAEAVFRARRDDPQFDFSGPVVEYAKAVETELNALVFGPLREALGEKAPDEQRVRIDGRTVDLGGRVSHQSLGTLRNLLEHDGTVRTGLKSALGRDGKWLVDELPYRLKPIVEMRNPAAHDALADPEEVKHRRRRILGIGCEGLLVRVVKGKG
jgi:hypothetical protein